MTPAIAFEYPASEAHVLDSYRAQFWLMLGWRWIGPVVLLTSGILLYGLVEDPYGQWLGVFCLLVGFTLFVAWAKTYRQFLVLARQNSRRLENSLIHVELSDHAIESRSSIGSTITRWEHITKRSMTKRFLVLYAGKQPVTCLPLSALSAEAKETIIRRTGGG
jgi:hypothetical protein